MCYSLKILALRQFNTKFTPNFATPWSLDRKVDEMFHIALLQRGCSDHVRTHGFDADSWWSSMIPNRSVKIA